jgi:hypothetical protein
MLLRKLGKRVFDFSPSHLKSTEIPQGLIANIKHKVNYEKGYRNASPPLSGTYLSN